MDPHLISATLSIEDQQAINGAIDTLRQKLPFLIDLTSAERIRMAKAANKTETFVRKAVEVANEHPQMFPNVFLDEIVIGSTWHETIPIRYFFFPTRN